MRRFLAVAAGAVLAAAAAGGCRDRAAPGTDAAVRDSAGVRIVSIPADAAAPRWQVSDAPVLEVEEGAGPDGAPLFGVVGAARLGDGRLVVATAGSHQLHLYGPGGEPVRSVGRHGSGPGEFEALGWVGVLPGDTVAAWDPALGRLSLFDAEGTLARTVSPEGADGLFPRVEGVFVDGSLAMTSGTPPAALFRAGRGAWRDTVTYLRIGPRGELLDTLGRLPGAEQYAAPPPGGRGTFRTMSVPFGRTAHASAAGARFAAGASDRYEVGIRAPDGTERVRLRRSLAPLPVTRGDVDAHREALAASGGGDAERRRERERMLAEAPYPETMPAFAALALDSEGHTWVRETRRPADLDRPTPWSVHAPDGTLAAAAVLPPRFAVHAIGPDWILGTHTDADGAERVRLHALSRTAP